MSKQTHTPGPWAAHRHESTDSYTIHVAGRSWETWAVAHVGDCTQDEANARLIAASPDLLEALRDMYAGWQYIRSFHGDLYGVGWDRCDEKASAAIAKATAG
jgi:hypothetical protein